MTVDEELCCRMVWAKVGRVSIKERRIKFDDKVMSETENSGGLTRCHSRRVARGQRCDMSTHTLLIERDTTSKQTKTHDASHDDETNGHEGKMIDRCKTESEEAEQGVRLEYTTRSEQAGDLAF